MPIRSEPINSEQSSSSVSKGAGRDNADWAGVRKLFGDVCNVSQKESVDIVHAFQPEWSSCTDKAISVTPGVVTETFSRDRKMGFL